MSSDDPRDEGTKDSGEPRLMHWLDVGSDRRDDSPGDGTDSTVGSTGGGVSAVGDGAETPGVGHRQTVPDHGPASVSGGEVMTTRPFDDLDDRDDEPVNESVSVPPVVPDAPTEDPAVGDDDVPADVPDDLDDETGEVGPADEDDDLQPAAAPSSWDELLGALSSPAASATPAAAGSARASKKTGRWGRTGKASRTRSTDADQADTDTDADVPAKARPRKTKRTSGPARGSVGRPAGFGAAGITARPARVGGRRRRVPVWARRSIGAGVVVVLIVGAVIAGRSMMGDQTPVESAADHPVQTSVPPMQSQVTSQPATPRHKDDSALPGRDVPVYAGQCKADQLPRGAEQISGSHKDLRSAAAAFQEEYFAHNAEGVKALIDDSNKAWRDQDWGKVLDSIPADATYCLTMPAVKSSMSTVTATLTMSTPGADDQTFRQKITGTSHDSLWQIKRMDAID